MRFARRLDLFAYIEVICAMRTVNILHVVVINVVQDMEAGARRKCRHRLQFWSAVFTDKNTCLCILIDCILFKSPSGRPATMNFLKIL